MFEDLERKETEEQWAENMRLHEGLQWRGNCRRTEPVQESISGHLNPA